MNRSPSVLRRYTPPTCTLEIIAKDSSLSRWAAKPVVKDLRFQLSLDDPKLSRDEWIRVQGDRAQLTALGEAVAHYVQQFLVLEPEQLKLPMGETATATATAIAPHPTTRDLQPPSALGITVQPSGLLNHELQWGELANAETGPKTVLSTVQLFDLANALDDYANDILDLPDRDRSGLLHIVPNWVQIAALVLITVGLSTSALRLFDGSGNFVATTPTNSQGASSNDQQIATQIAPEIADRATPPVISQDKLPTPPPTKATPSPKASMPTITMPKLPASSPTAGATPETVPPGAIAAMPVPAVPGAPIIVQESGGAKPPRSLSKADPYSATAAAPATQSNANIQARRGNSSEAPNTGDSTAFDTIPQVAEARSFFQQRWKPPESLNHILEYSIQVNSDGTVERITPLRQASGDYIDRTGMPLIGDSFVSPLKGRQSAKIRVVLEPNGQVHTFLEP